METHLEGSLVVKPPTTAFTNLVLTLGWNVIQLARIVGVIYLMGLVGEICVKCRAGLADSLSMKSGTTRRYAENKFSNLMTPPSAGWLGVPRRTPRLS